MSPSNSKPSTTKATLIATVAYWGTWLLLIFIAYYYLFFRGYSFINPYYYSKKAGTTKDNFLIGFQIPVKNKHISFEQYLSQDNGLEYVDEYTANNYDPSGVQNYQYIVTAAQYDTSVSDFASYATPQLTSFLKKDINFRASLVSGETVNNIYSTQFQGRISVKATLTCGNNTCYELEFANPTNNIIYSIMGAGVSQSSFNSFANTFKYYQTN